MKNTLRIFLCAVFVASFAVIAQAQYSAKKNAEPFTGTALNGESFDLEALKGKVVVMTFWSTRCAVCAGEIPHLNRLAEQYKGKDVVFLGLTNEDPNRVNAFLKSKPFNFNILPNSFGVLLKYADKDSQGRINMPYPSFYVINQNGQIEMRASGYGKSEAVGSKISNLLADKSAKSE